MFSDAGCRELTHWGRVTHICVSKITITGSDNGLSPRRRQAIIGTSVGMLLIGPLGTNFSEILSDIDIFSFKQNAIWKTAAILSRPQCVNRLRIMCTLTALSCLPFLFGAASPSHKDHEVINVKKKERTILTLYKFKYFVGISIDVYIICAGYIFQMHGSFNQH